MKVMIYSQHVLGVGHFFRSMQIAEALRAHEVLFVEGGEPLEGFTPPPHVRRFFLPPLMMDEEFKRFEISGEVLEETKSRRKELLLEAFGHFAPDVFLCELFPFGRKQFRFELLPILEAIGSRGLPTRVVCSLRDILVEKKDREAYEEGVLKILNHSFHLLLIHSDPRLIALDETFERVAAIRIPLEYTGFIVRPAPPRSAARGFRQILASSGGGKVGVDLLAATLQAVRALPDPELRLHVFIGPFMSRADRERLEALAAADPRSALRPFATDFPSELARADLSISMAGYNTCMDLLSTGAKALVYPFAQNREQALRARKLETMGLVRVIESLEVSSFSASIREALEAPAPQTGETLDLCGARKTALAIEKLIAPQSALRPTAAGPSLDV